MDPVACIERAWSAYHDGDVDEAMSAMQDYFRWKSNGGFTTEETEARYEALLVALEGE